MKNGGGIHLVLLYSLHSNAIAIAVINCNIRIAKLAMAQQFPKSIPRIKVLVVSKIDSFPTRDGPNLPSREIPHILRRMPLFLLVILLITLRFVARALLFPRRHKRGAYLDGRPRGVALLVGGVCGVAGSALLRGGIADAHFDAAQDFALLFRKSKDCGYGTRMEGRWGGSCEKRNGI